MALYVQAIMILVFLGSVFMDQIAALPSQHGAIPPQIQSKGAIHSPPNQSTISQQTISTDNSNPHTVSQAEEPSEEKALSTSKFSTRKTDSGNVMSTSDKKNKYSVDNSNHTSFLQGFVGKRVQNVYAFTAELSEEKQVSDGSPVIFNNVLVNEGGMYVNNRGQFICPDDGVYMFIWAVKPFVNSSSRCIVSLSMGSLDIKYGPKTSIYRSDSYWNGNSKMITVLQCRLEPISAVTVVSRVNPAPTFQGYYSTFSGYRLSSIEAAIGFTAELSQDVYLFPGGRIFFDKVVSNIGGKYHDEHGFFECPDDSIYSFTISAHCPEYPNQWSVTQLVFDREVVMQGPITYWSTTSEDSGSSSVAALLHCQQGKAVYVEAKDSYTFPYNVYGAGLTTFSGARLCSTECDDYVAFSAILRQNLTDLWEDIVFDKVLVNQGSDYNPSTGVFTCPDDKLYLFTWCVTSTYAATTINLYLNSTYTKANFLTYTGTSSPYSRTSGTGCQSTVIKCVMGTTVTVRSSSSYNRVLLADYTNFSGYRIPGQ